MAFINQAGRMDDVAFASLQDAEAALRLINAARQARGEGELELTALEVARARTIRALDALLRDGPFWESLHRPKTRDLDHVSVQDAVADAVARTLVRVGHVPPPPAASLILVAQRYLDLPLADNTGLEIAAATRAGLNHLRRVLVGLAGATADAPAAAPYADLEQRRTGLATAGKVLLHLVSAGGLAVTGVSPGVTALTHVACTVAWGAAINVGTDVLTDKAEPAVVTPPATASTEPPPTSPFGRLRGLTGPTRTTTDPTTLRNLRQDLLDDIAGSNRWSAEYRLARLDQLVMDGAVSAAEATPVRMELERQRASGR